MVGFDGLVASPGWMGLDWFSVSSLVAFTWIHTALVSLEHMGGQDGLVETIWAAPQWLVGWNDVDLASTLDWFSIDETHIGFR